MTQAINDGFVAQTGGQFLERNDALNRLGNIVSNFLALPGLRGFWTCGVSDGSGGLIDLAGNGLTLTNNNSVLFSRLTTGQNLIPICVFDGATEYFSRADEAALDTTGNEAFISGVWQGMSLGGWFKFDDAPVLGAIENMIAKDDQVANNRSYVLQRLTTGQVGFIVWDSTNTLFSNNDGPTISDITDWHFISVRANCNDQTVNIFVDGTDYTGSGGCGTDIDNTTSPFTVGASGAPNRYFDGWMSMIYLCAMDIGSSAEKALFQQSKVLFGV